MKASKGFAARAWLLSAGAGIVLGPAVALMAQTNGSNAPSNAPKSDIQKQLEELYRRDGREMPPMTLNELPAGPVPAEQAPAPSGRTALAAPAPVAPQKEQRPNLFQRIFGIGRKSSKKSAAPPRSTSAPRGFLGKRSSSAKPRPEVTTTPSSTAAAPRLLPQQLRSSQSAVDAPATFGNPAAASVVQPPAPAPAPAGLIFEEPDEFNPEPNATTEPVVSSGTVDEFENPFTDVSETEADGDMNPFRELALDGAANADPTGLPAADAADVLADEQDAADFEAPLISPFGAPEPDDSAFAPTVTSQPPAQDSTEPAEGEFVKPLIVSQGSDAADSSEEAPSLAPPAPAEGSPFVKTFNDVDDAFRVIDRPQADPSLPVPTPRELPMLPAVPAESHAAIEVDQVARVSRLMERITKRKDATGLKGFCVATLRDRRELVDASDEFYADYGAQTYYFSSAEAKADFENNPEAYVPAFGGNDVTLLGIGREEVQGTLDFALWYNERLYLFCCRTTRELFVGNPTRFLDKIR